MAKSTILISGPTGSTGGATARSSSKTATRSGRWRIAKTTGRSSYKISALRSSMATCSTFIP
jgi:hypothetical protein